MPHEEKTSYLNGNGVRRWAPIVQTAITILIIPFCVWIVSEIHEIQKWQAATQANRFTVQDGIEVWTEIHEIHEDLVKIKTGFPSIEFMKVFNEFKTDMRSDMVQVKSRLVEIEKKID